MPFVQLKASKHLRKAGTTHTYRAGDWVEVGKQTALAWIAEGSAVNPTGLMDLPKDVLQDRSGVVVRGNKADANLAIFDTFKGLLRFTYGPPRIRYEHTLIWDPAIKLWPEQILLGFSRIQKTRDEYDSWEMAVMLANNTALAQDIGSAKEQNLTRKVVGDLRLPVYNTQAIWVRKTTASEQTILKWATALENGEHPQHAFLRALYTEQPLICTLPADWFGGRRR